MIPRTKYDWVALTFALVIGVMGGMTTYLSSR